MIIAYYPIHYGSDYLGYSIKSIYDRVDQIHILYAKKPSHGHGTDLNNPDTFDKLKEASLQFGATRWIVARRYTLPVRVRIPFACCSRRVAWR